VAHIKFEVFGLDRYLDLDIRSVTVHSRAATRSLEVTGGCGA